LSINFAADRWTKLRPTTLEPVNRDRPARRLAGIFPMTAADPSGKT
jgi:hypothetical protein